MRRLTRDERLILAEAKRIKTRLQESGDPQTARYLQSELQRAIDNADENGMIRAKFIGQSSRGESRFLSLTVDDVIAIQNLLVDRYS